MYFCFVLFVRQELRIRHFKGVFLTEKIHLMTNHAILTSSVKVILKAMLTQLFSYQYYRWVVVKTRADTALTHGPQNPTSPKLKHPWEKEEAP